MSVITLASKSAARAGLLASAGVAFETTGSGVDEDEIKVGLLAKRASPLAIARTLAEAKAVAVSSRRPGLVIGADQTLDLDGQLFDKAASLDEGRERLVRLRGRRHQLHSGVALAQGGEVIWRQSESASLSMRAFSDRFLEDYLARNGEAVLSSVGCYQLEGEGLQLFDRIDGDYFCILGLPLLPLLAELRRLGAIAA
ncbi:MAG TPA: Maf family protein [Caulobacteraceae bacterium]|nr:Maf family protein [Caulobacteraceae bacterium]